MPDDLPGITVLIPTYNRATVLVETLEALTRVNRTGIDCSIVVIDNNSSDNTADVVKEYKTRLPVSYLRESRPGKSCALNKALRECALKEIVIFTDDDVTPARNWFQEVVASVTKWPAIGAFGGKVEVAWPDNKQPEWAVRDWMGFGFSRHDYADGDTLYTPPDCPVGPNFWVRKHIIRSVPPFDETLGPWPKRIMGEETSFLMNLLDHGFPILYYPGAAVHHRILREGCTVPWLRRRAYTHGRAQVRFHGFHRCNIYHNNKILWWLVLMVDELYTMLRLLAGFAVMDTSRNCATTVNAMMRFGNIHETVNQVLKRFRAGAKSSKKQAGVSLSGSGEVLKARYEKID